MTKNPPTREPAARSCARAKRAATLAAALLAAPLATAAAPQAPAQPGDTVLPAHVQPAARRAWMARQSALCLGAIAEAGARYNLPPGLLAAISRVETGRRLPVTNDRQPWPWSVNADGASLFFDTRAQAMAATTLRLAGGARYVDIGCMQVDLRMHADAFPTLADAFNPARNADYAARLLLSLRAGHGGEERGWARAAGLYHSATPGLMEPYQASVARMRATQHPPAGP